MPLMIGSRATQDDIVTDMMAIYYAQRATAGFIVSKGTQICPR